MCTSLNPWKTYIDIISNSYKYRLKLCTNVKPFYCKFVLIPIPLNYQAEKDSLPNRETAVIW